MNINDKVKAFGITQAINYLEKDPERNIPKLMEMADRFMSKDEFTQQRDAIRASIEKKDNWYQLLMRIYELDNGARSTFFNNFILNENVFGWPQ